LIVVVLVLPFGSGGYRVAGEAAGEQTSFATKVRTATLINVQFRCEKHSEARLNVPTTSSYRHF
jgi:hypothetical protein